ncbi:MAG: Lrp/AsnC family transcriptional regulator [Pseudomonadota bacterium]
MFKFDHADKKLLQALQANCRLTSDQLSEACGLSPTAALKRVKQLRSEGVITKEVAVIAPKKVGLNVLAIVMVTLERESKHTIDSFKKDIRKAEQIVNGYYVTGDADFVLTIAVSSMDDYEEFTRDFFYDRHKIKSFKTLVVLDPVKTHAQLPINFMAE